MSRVTYRRDEEDRSLATHMRKPLSSRIDALDILASWIKDDPAMRQIIAEERSNASIARQIYELRTARGLTQHELAELIGTKQPVIARLENAAYVRYSLATLTRIGEALDCDLSVSFLPRSQARGRSHRRRRPTRTEQRVRANTK
jgi:ribosome-binding protein aMBF1 (putative translation factor)